MLMMHKKVNLWDAHGRIKGCEQRLHIWLLKVVTVGLVLAVPVLAQNIETPEAKPGNIVGTVTDVNDNTVPGATVVLESSVSSDRQTVVTDDNGFFQFRDI